jgi:HEPN domain-containing protein
MASPEATRLMRIALRDLTMARRLLDQDVEEASWGWAVQQYLEKPLKAWLHSLGIQSPQTHDLARLLLLLQEAGVDISRSASTWAACRGVSTTS